MRPDRRVDRRIAAELHVEFTSLEDFVSAYTQDVSRSGFFLPTEQFLPTGAVVSVNIVLPNNGPKLKAIVRVAYVLDKEKAERGKRQPGMGMEFLDVEGNPFADQITEYIQQAVSQIPDASSVSVPVPRAQVLVVDDSEPYRLMASKAMLAAGFDVVTAKDGLDGLGEALRERPDLILTDVKMPKMDGWQFLRLVRSRPNLAHIPVVFLTTLSGEQERLKGYRLGVDDYLGKPFNGAELAARVERVLARGHTPRGGPGNKAMHGDLALVGLTSVLSLAEMERRTGSLMLVRKDECITMYLREGKVVRIDLPPTEDGRQGIERFFYALDWKTGQFELSATEVAVEEDLDFPSSFVMLEHARRSDQG